MKNILRTLLPLLFTACLATAAAAAESEARQALEQKVGNVLHILDTADLTSPEARLAALNTGQAEIIGLFDFKELSARTVGPSWNSFSEDQKNRFTDAFTTLLRTTYAEKLEGYDGGTVTYTGETMNTKGDRIEIRTRVVLKNSTVGVDYRMAKKSAGWLVYDVIVEGVSLVQNYRSQFQDLLVKNDAEYLIAQVQKKAREMTEVKPAER